MLPTSEYIGLMEHALGRSADPRHDLYATLNRAGRALTTCHSWAWRSGSAVIPSVSGQQYLDLPEDYGRFTKATVPNTGAFPGIVCVSLDEIYTRRAMVTYAATTGLLYAAFPWWQQRANADSGMTRRAQIWPTPSSNGVPTVTLYYERTWVDLSAADQSQPPEIPDIFESALVDLARAFACAIEYADPNNMRPMPDPLTFPSVVRLMAEDGSGNGWTMPRGGASVRMRRGPAGNNRNENLTVPMAVN